MKSATGRLKMQDWNMTEQIIWMENAGLENDGVKCIHYSYTVV